MICEKCNTQFKCDLSLAQSGTMFGLCTKCGRRLKYDDVPEGFAFGSILGLTSTPLVFAVFFSWSLLLSTLVVMLVSIYLAWLIAKKQGGYIVAHSVDECKKGNAGLAILSGILGVTFAYTWFWLVLAIAS